MTSAANLDVVVPSAYPAEMLERTLRALARAVDEAGVPREQVVLVDEQPNRSDDHLVEGQGFRRLVTGGLGNGPARNRGAAVGVSDLLVFVDDDVELDPDALVRLLETVPGALDDGHLGVVGGMRPPGEVPGWLLNAYADTTVNPAAAAAGAAALPVIGLAVTMLAIPRETFEAVGGLPERSAWGWIDTLFGFRLRRHFGPDATVLREPSFSGVHHYVPTWTEWLDRFERAGERLVDVREELDHAEFRELLSGLSLGRRPRHVVKRTLGVLPSGMWRTPRSGPVAKAAAAAALARGYRKARARG